MAVNITEADLAAALRVGSSVEETAEVTRLLAYCTEAISKHLGAAYEDAPEVIVNEAVIRLAGYQYDRPYAPRGTGIREGPGELWSGSDPASVPRSPRGIHGRGQSLMPIDRRITIQIRGEDQRDRYGELVPRAHKLLPCMGRAFR